MFIKNAQLYRLDPAFFRSYGPHGPIYTQPLVGAGGAAPVPDLSMMLRPVRFAPCLPQQAESHGFAAQIHVTDGAAFLTLITERKIIPAETVNRMARETALELEQTQSFAPGKKAMKEIKERVVDSLLPNALTQQRRTTVIIDTRGGWLIVDAASATTADLVIKLLLKAIDRLPLESLRVRSSPGGSMTQWLADPDETPAGFTIDQDATLRATGESKAVVQFKSHVLDPSDIWKHIHTGKQCTRLAMTWDSKVSFQLDEGLTLRSIKPLDVLTSEPQDDGGRMLCIGEMRKLLSDLVEALGGEARP